jgi:hypothetical protein
VALAGCETTPVSPSAEDNGAQNLSADLYVQKDNKSFRIKSELTIINPEAIRLELRTTVDVPLATIVLTTDKIQYILFHDKKFYSGKPGPHALDPLFPLSVDAKTLVEILEEVKVPGSSCTSDDGTLSSCAGQINGSAFSANWSKRGVAGPLSGRASKIVLELPDRHVSLKFYITDWQRNISNAEHMLSLKVPSGFSSFSTP